MSERSPYTPPEKPYHDWDSYASGIADNITRHLQSENEAERRYAQGQIRFHRFTWSVGEGLGGMVLSRLIAYGVIDSFFDENNQDLEVA